MFGLLMKLLVCWILLSSPAWSYGKTPTPVASTDKPNQHNHSPQEKPATDQRGTEETPLVIKVLPSAKNEPSADNIAKNKNSESANWWWDRSPEIILALATIGLGVATWRLVSGAKDTAKKELRAYMGVEHIVIHDEFRDGPPKFGKLVIRNFGKTMAKDTQTWIVGVLATVGEMTNFPLSERKSKTVVMPNEAIGFDEPIEIEAGDLALFNQGVGNIYLWGRIEYNDVFEEPHWTTFRFMSYKRERFSPDITGWAVKTCDEGNDAT